MVIMSRIVDGFSVMDLSGRDSFVSGGNSVLGAVESDMSCSYSFLGDDLKRAFVRLFLSWLLIVVWAESISWILWRIDCKDSLRDFSVSLCCGGVA